MYLSEKAEFRLKLIINCILLFLLILAVVVISDQSKYTEQEHQVEQGTAAVYLTEDSSKSASKDVEPLTREEYVKTLELSSYAIVEYEDILKSCSKKNKDKVLLKVTVYSVLEVGDSYVYNAADANGNYYSITEGTGFFQKYEKADVLQVCAITNSTSKLNGAEIPALKADYISKSN